MTELVALQDEIPLAAIPKTTKKDSNGHTIPNSGQLYILAFGKSRYFLPAAAIRSYPRRAHVLEDGHAVGKLVATKAPDKWEVTAIISNRVRSCTRPYVLSFVCLGLRGPRHPPLG
jgi:hypothetical protein